MLFLYSKLPVFSSSFLYTQNTALLTLAMEEDKMLEEHKSYHENITGEEAETRLELFCKHRNCNICHLTRYSIERKQYVLSVLKKQKSKNTVMHFKIILENKKRRIEGKTKWFDSIEELLNHYAGARIHAAFMTIGQSFDEKDYEQILEEEEVAEKERIQKEADARQQAAEDAASESESNHEDLDGDENELLQRPQLQIVQEQHRELIQDPELPQEDRVNDQRPPQEDHENEQRPPQPPQRDQQPAEDQNRRRRWQCIIM